MLAFTNLIRIFKRWRRGWPHRMRKEMWTPCDQCGVRNKYSFESVVEMANGIKNFEVKDWD